MPDTSAQKKLVEQQSVTEDDVVTRLQPAVKAAPGVATLVPSLTTALGRLRLGRASVTPTGEETETSPGETSDGSAADTSSDGVSVTLDGQTVTAVLDITVTSQTSVLETARAVHAIATTVLEHSHPGRHTVTVNVLGRDPDATTTHAEPTTSSPRPAPPTASPTPEGAQR